MKDDDDVQHPQEVGSRRHASQVVFFTCPHWFWNPGQCVYVWLARISKIHQCELCFYDTWIHAEIFEKNNINKNIILIKIV